MVQPTALRSALVDTTTPLTQGRVIETGTRLHAPTNNAVGAGKVNAARAVTGAETTVVTNRALAALGGVGVLGVVAVGEGVLSSSP